MTRKPSLTKQIAEVLETEDKREQLERVQALKQQVTVPSVAVTVLFSYAGIRLSVASTSRINAEDVKFILQKGIDEITSQVVRQQMEQELNEGPPGMPEPPDDILAEEPLNDSEVPDLTQEQLREMDEQIAQHLEEHPDQGYMPAS